MSNTGALPQGFGEGVDPPIELEMQIYDMLPAHVRKVIGECVFDVSPYRVLIGAKHHNMTDVEVIDNLRQMDAMLLEKFRAEAKE